MPSAAAKMMLERRTVRPTENEIAKVAHQLWTDSGCPAGSDRDDWFRAQAMLKNAPIAKFEDLSRSLSIPRCEIRTESTVLFEFRCDGHWETWESEWGGAHWVANARPSMR